MDDLIIVGGGLAGCLIAYRLHQLQPQSTIRVLEAGERLGGNHTWSFFATDVGTSRLGWLEPFVEYRWPGYDVRFPSRRRRLSTEYLSFTSTRLHEVVTDALPADCVRLGIGVEALTPESVTLAEGASIEARAVIDARGPCASRHMAFGYQKFTGQELELENPHGLDLPILMDATVEQDGDYRFMYTLPLAPNRVLVEDTRYGNDLTMDPERDRAAIERYVTDAGWRIQGVIREEQGVLPVSLGGDMEAFWDEGPAVARAGLRAGLFHATTGYSLPRAAELADLVAAAPELSTSSLRCAIRSHARSCWRHQGYLRLLNRMMFLAAEPERRYRIFERFYGLGAGLIERFYADRLTLADRVRILTGRPPVPVSRALRCVSETAAWSSAP